MAAKRFFRKLLLLAGFFLLSMIVGLLLFPLWFPWVLKPLSRNSGLTYGEFERHGYSRFALRDVSYTNASAGLGIQATRVEAPIPTAWLWSAKTGGGGAGAVAISNWELSLGRATVKAKREGRVTPRSQPRPQLTGQLLRTIAKINQWLASAHLSNGTIRSGKTEIQLPDLNWNRGHLTGSARLRGTPIVGDLRLDLRKLPYELQFDSRPLQISLSAQVSTNAIGPAISGTAYWQSNRFEVAAQLPASSLIPVAAQLRAPEFLLATNILSLPGYAPLRGSVQAGWTNGQFEVIASGAARPQAGKTNFPSLQFGLLAEGNTNEAIVRSAYVTAPWLHIELSRDVALMARAPWLRDPAQLTVDLDLGRQPFIDLRGTARANAFLQPQATGLPSMHFHMVAQDLERKALRMRSAVMEADLDWPWLRVPVVEAELQPDTTVTLSGRADLSRRIIRDGRFTLRSANPPPVLGKLPVNYAGLTAHGSVEGPLARLRHRLDLSAAKIAVPGMQPLTARVHSEGGLRDSTNLLINLSPRNGAELAVAGSLIATNGGAEMLLRHWQLTANGQPALATTNFARLRFMPGPGKRWHADVEDFAVQGPAGSLEVDGQVSWPELGQVRVLARDLSAALIQEFVARPLPPLRVETLNAGAVWTNGPVQFLIAGALAEPGTNFPFRAEARLRGDRDGVVIEQAALIEQTNALAGIQGRLPLSLWPTRKNLLHVDAEGELNLRASARPRGSLWSRLRTITGVGLTEPQLAAELSGTWSQPVGRVDFKAARIFPPGFTNRVPEIGPATLAVRAEGDRAWIERLDVTVQGQRVNITGEVPLGQEFWRFYAGRKLPDWTKASGHLQISRAPISAFQPLAHKILAPEGEVEVDVSLLPGGKLDGIVNVAGARTDSIGTLGPVRDITLRIELQDQAARITQGRARIGGANVQLAGTADLTPTNLLPGFVPPFKLSVRGERVPLSRQADAIIRGDLDLRLIATNGPQPVLAGKVSLRDSYYLSDLGALVPGKVADPRRRPPYFSITDKPLTGWNLAVQVNGNRGLKIRSPIFAGEVTPNLQLSGTLKDPVAVGDVRVDSGAVRFPFGSLTVEQGMLTASPQDASHPQISVIAADRQFGYDIRMEASGSVESPVLQFSSTPPLTSDQVLLMLTAGELPRGNITLSPQQRAQTFAMFIGRDLLSKFGVGEGENRLIMRSGEEFSDQGRPTYDVEYRLSKRWSITGEYDRFGDFNAGVKWRVYSK